MKRYQLKRVLATLLPDCMRVNGSWNDYDGDPLDNTGTARWGSYHYMQLTFDDHEPELDEIEYKVREVLAEYADYLDEYLAEIRAWIGKK